MKKNYTKQLFVAIFALLCSLTATAYDFEVNGIYYNIPSTSDLTVEVAKSDHKYSGNVVIPSTVNYNGENYSVTGIGRFAFQSCSNLTSVTIPNSVTSIGDQAFDGCSLTSVTIPNSVTNIGNSAFYYCLDLTSVTIGNSVTSIGNQAFAGCRYLTSVNVNDLGAWCKIYFKSTYSNPLCYAKNLYLNGDKVTNLVIPKGVTEIKNYAFNGCSSLTSVSIPNSVTSIGNSAFSSCSSLTKVTIGNSVTSIGNYAFYGCSSLTKVTIGNSVTSIGEQAFADCSGLTSVNVNDIGAWCKIYFVDSFSNPLLYAKNLYLNGEKVTNLVIPEGVTEIKYKAFTYCSGLTSITIPNSVTSIGKYAFDYCSGLKTVINLSSLTISKGLTDNGYVGFYADKVINAPNGSIEGDFVFGKIDGNNTLCGYIGNATELSLPENYKGGNYVIGNEVFRGLSGLTSVTIPNSVTSIGWAAFCGCSGLTNVTIGNSVTSIGNYAFEGCSGLKTVINLSSLTISKGSYSNGYVGYYADKVINAPNGYIEGDFYFSKIDGNNTLCGYIGNATELSLPENHKGGNYLIGNDAFESCTSLTSITIPNSVTSIGNYAFYGCSGLKTVINLSNFTISKGSTDNGYVGLYADKVINAPNGSIEGDFVFGKIDGNNTLCGYIGNATELSLPENYKGKNYVIGDYAFYGCSGLTNVVIPNSVTSIGYDAFRNCTSLTSVTIPNSVISIGDRAFSSCSGLTNVTIGNSVTRIGNYAFCNCTSLTSIKIPNSVISIGGCAFFSCSGLTNVTIGNSVTSIGNYAFEDCSALTSVTIPNSVTSIGDKAFYYCSGLKEVHISDIAAWCNISFEDYYANPVYYSDNLYLNGELIKDLIIPDGVTSIGNYAFYNSRGLTSVKFPNSVTSIGSSAFSGCSALKTVINLSLLTIFKGSYSNGYVGYYADKVINAPNGYIEGDFYFSKIDGNNTLCGYIGNATELSLPENHKGENYVIGETAFYGCSDLKSITIPNSVTNIGDYAFNGCNGLTSVALNCKRIGNFFGDNNNISEIILGSNVFGILDDALSGCSGIKSIKFTSAQPPRVGTGNFTSSQYQNVVLYVPKGSLAAYQAADVWKEFWEIIEYEVTAIEDVEEDAAPTFEITAGGILFTAAEGKVVAIYTTGGALVEKIDCYAGEEITLDKGVYIVRVGNKSVKVKL